MAGLHYNDSDLVIWRARAAANLTVNAANQGWPNITTKTATFMSNPSAEIWTGVTRAITEAVQKGDTPMPVSEGKNVLMAAFYALVEESQTHAYAVRDFFASQMTEAKTDFSNTTHWTDQETSDGPFWGIAEWLVRMLYSFDYIKDYLTAQEKSNIETWLSNAATFFHTQLTSHAMKYFATEADRANSNVLDNYGGSVLSSDPYMYNSAQMYTHRDSLYNHYNALRYGNAWFHNRMAAMAMFVGLAGVYFNNTAWKNNAKYYFKNNIILQMFPDGMNAEALRSTTDGNVEAAFYYSAAIYSDMAHYVEALRRVGDSELISLVTSQGYYNSAGGQKSLKLGWQSLVRLREQRFINNSEAAFSDRTVTNDETNKIDGLTPGSWYGVHHCWAAISNFVYNDNELYEGYKMTNLGGYPSSPMSGTSSYMMQGGTLPDVLFMFGDREGEIVNTPGSKRSMMLIQ